MAWCQEFRTNIWKRQSFYKSKQDAKESSQAGGSGFLIGYKDSIQEPKHIYAVTNAHVVIDGFTTIRLNAEHETATVETKTSDWIMDPDGDDLAITLLPVQPNHEYKYFYSDVLLDETGAKEHGIGPGDDVFMIGRLIAHSGTKRNLPVARFGNIAMLPLREPQELPSKEPTARSGRDAFDERF